MNKNEKGFSDWCNEHKGVIELMILLVAILGTILDNLHSLSNLNLFSNLISFLNYTLAVPIYIILIIIILMIIYLRRVRRIYKKNRIDFNFMVGKWRLDYDGVHNGNPVKGSEYLEITKDAKYLINNIQKFEVKDFKVDEITHKVTFTKKDISSNNNIGDLLNLVYLVNNEQLNGVETGTNIQTKVQYKKIN